MRRGWENSAMLRPIRAFCASGLLLLLCAPLSQARGAGHPGPDPAAASARIQSDVDYLASKACAGRRVGSPGCALAQAYIEAELQALGLVPLGDTAADGSRSFAQAFDVTRGIKPVKAPQLSLAGTALAADSDFAIAPFSGSGAAAEASLVFIGYGIHAPELGWDDYASVEAKGAILVAVRGEPQEQDSASRFSGSQPSIYSDMRRKAATARDMGAAALLLVDSPLPAADGSVLPDELPQQHDVYSAANFDIPVLFLRRAPLEPLIRAAAGCSLADLLLSIDSTNQPITLSFEPKAGLDVQVEKDIVSGYNLIGAIAGTDPALASQYIVLGAHYDHLGDGGPESLASPQHGALHLGADDNASGVAAVLELARHFRANPPQRSLLLCFFSGEEIGAVGSAFLADHLPVAQEAVYAMLNYDMVGRMVDGRLIMEGAGTAAEFQSILDATAVAAVRDGLGLSLATGQSGFGASDHMNFLRLRHPVLFFFTGVHSDYHRPSDTADKINAAGIARICCYSAALVDALAGRPEPLTFVEVSAPGDGKQRAQLTVTLGTIPSYTQSEISGMPISDVKPGGPAAVAGLLGGDVIIGIGGKRVANIYDFIFALQDKQPGEVVEVRVNRSGVELVFSVTLAARNVQQ